MSEADRLIFLMEEISILKTKIRPEDTGHIYTTISTLESRVAEVKGELNGTSS